MLDLWALAGHCASNFDHPFDGFFLSFSSQMPPLIRGFLLALGTADIYQALELLELLEFFYLFFCTWPSSCRDFKCLLMEEVTHTLGGCYRLWILDVLFAFAFYLFSFFFFSFQHSFPSYIWKDVVLPIRHGLCRLQSALPAARAQIIQELNLEHGMF
ncbi:hypothetical protein EDB81DRAFT_469875 [Dactylonectria macrodidyma]|uniref:Uncharacterized protein n=1 Tax=Dactylonectria macrodidyma TaxID=307937 RepID=A0A9P9EYM8_9HYPO|nr:hypothetical protein EDB81DRAFT_469875 [Dactylonectria macrodidyma]